MIKSVNFCQNIQFSKNLAFKSQQENSPVSSPIENISMKGADALASYNSAFIKSRDKFDIPLLKPVSIPKDINAIEGERIYNSKGSLECIVKETKDKKYVYSQNCNDLPGVNCLEIYDRRTGNKIFDQGEYVYIDDGKETKHCIINEFDSISGQQIFNTFYDNGMPISKSYTTYNPDGTYEHREYQYDTDEYNVWGDGLQNKTYDKTYDANGNLKYAHYCERNDDSIIRREMKYVNNRESSRETTEQKAIKNPELEKYLHNPKLIPAECPEFLTNIDNIDGEKTYYSNGQVESVKTADGKIYEISLNGKSITLQDGDKTIEFSNNIDNGNRFCSVSEESGNTIKRTVYCGKNGNELSDVTYTKGNIEKYISYENGKPTYYSESDNSVDDWSMRNLINIRFAPNGGVLEVDYGRRFTPLA